MEQKIVINVATNKIFFESNFIFCYYSNKATSKISIFSIPKFFLKVTLYSVTIAIKLPQKYQYVHLTAHDYSC